MTWLARVCFDDMIYERLFWNPNKARRWAAYHAKRLSPATWYVKAI